MNHSNGHVVSLEGDTATVRFARSDACAHCGACDLFGKNADVRLENRIGARVGDEVRVELQPGRVAGASALAYAVPLAGLLAGVVAGNAVAGDGGALIGGLLGVAVCAAVLFGIERKLRASRTFAPVIVQVVAPGGESAGKPE